MIFLKHKHVCSYLFDESVCRQDNCRRKVKPWIVLQSTRDVEMLEQGPLPQIYNMIFYTVHGKYVTYK